MSAPLTTAKSDSRLNNSETTIGLESFCASICNVYATPLDKMPVYRIAHRQIRNASALTVSPVTTAPSAETTVIIKNCAHESATPSTRREKWSMSRICAAYTNALTRMGKDLPVTMDNLGKVCKALNCELEDIVQYIPDEDTQE